MVKVIAAGLGNEFAEGGGFLRIQTVFSFVTARQVAFFYLLRLHLPPRSIMKLWVGVGVGREVVVNFM